MTPVTMTGASEQCKTETTGCSYAVDTRYPNTAAFHIESIPSMLSEQWPAQLWWVQSMASADHLLHTVC